MADIWSVLDSGGQWRISPGTKDRMNRRKGREGSFIHTVAPSRTKSSYEKGGLRISRTYNRMSRQTSDTDSPKAAVIMTQAP